MSDSTLYSRMWDSGKNFSNNSPANKKRNPPWRNSDPERPDPRPISSSGTTNRSPAFRYGNEDNYRPQPRNRDSYRPSSNSNRRPLKSDFTFRSEKSGPRFSPNSKYDDTRSAERRSRDQQDKARRGRGRSFRWQRSMNDRPLLRSKRETTPENMLNTGDGVVRFKDVDDLSESEADMDIEEDSGSGSEIDAEAAIPAKRVRVDEGPDLNGNSTPKWSNPDPYAFLPPTDEAHAKRKDVVKLIRKAKVDQMKDASVNSITENVDFISFDAENVEEQSNESDVSRESEFSLRKDYRKSQKFSHLRNLHGDLDNSEPPIRSENMRQQSYRSNDRDRWPSPDNLSSRRGDEIPQNSRKRKRNDLPDGSILREWVCKSRVTATPWCTVDHSRSNSTGLWLHKEICDYYDYVKPRHFERKIREDLVLRLESCMSKLYPGITVESFGSFASGLYLPTADMDLVIISDEYRKSGYARLGTTLSFMHRFAKQLGRAGMTRPESVEVIWHAKVPIIKFVDRLTGLKVDLSFENVSGIVALETFHIWKKQFPAMPVLVTLVKQFLLIRGLNEVFTGGLGGFTVICIVVSMLQHLPQLQSGNMNQEHHLGELFMNFLDLYGNKFNLVTNAISMDPPGYFPKRDLSTGLSILDPNLSKNDISKGSRNVEAVFSAFSKAFALLQQRMFELSQSSYAERENRSILGCVLGADYSSFERQRNRLRRTYEQR